MYKIILINMPFAAFNLPSLGLTQLKAVLDSQYEKRVSVELLYINQDFARHMGINIAQHIEQSSQAHNSGLGEWFFRQAAYPELPDNTEEYLQRYYPSQKERTGTMMLSILEKREGINHFMDSLIDRHRIDQAHLVGFTSMFTQNTACFALARKLKERNPDLIVVMGGANCEGPMGAEIVKNVDQVDYVFSGPGLVSFPEFVQHCLQGDMERCSRIKGVFSKTNSGEDDKGTDGSVGDDLDINSMPEIEHETFLSTFENNFQNEKIRPKLFFETSRGCWWGERSHCTFCGLNDVTLNYRAMSPQKAIDQFNSLFKYSDRCSEFKAIDKIMPKNYVQDVLPLLNPPPNTSIFYEVRANLSSEELLILSRAGVKHVQPGIEALATGTLKLMKKGTTAFQNLLFLKNCRTADIKPGWNLLVGFPGEAEEVYRKYVNDIPLLTHLYPPTGAYPVRFDRYSTYFIEAEKYGLDLRPYDFYEMVYPFSKESLASLAYYFMDHNFSAQYFSTMVKWITKIKEAVEMWKNRWNDSAHSVLPQLFFKKKGTSGIVYDSRSGKVIEHKVGDVGRQILEQLSRQRSISHLASEIGHILNFDPEKEIVYLQERGLVFEERGLFMSLVLPEETRLSYQVAESSNKAEDIEDSDAENKKPSLVPIARKAYSGNLSSLTKSEDGT